MWLSLGILMQIYRRKGFSHPRQAVSHRADNRIEFKGFLWLAILDAFELLGPTCRPGCPYMGPSRTPWRGARRESRPLHRVREPRKEERKGFPGFRSRADSTRAARRARTVRGSTPQSRKSNFFATRAGLSTELAVCLNRRTVPRFMITFAWPLEVTSMRTKNFLHAGG
jgi:hypothetical protein